jgi:hypothetical protein
VTPRETSESEPRDPVDVASEESMDASDSPARGLVRTGEPLREGDAAHGSENG